MCYLTCDHSNILKIQKLWKSCGKLMFYFGIFQEKNHKWTEIIASKGHMFYQVAHIFFIIVQITNKKTLINTKHEYQWLFLKKKLFTLCKKISVNLRLQSSNICSTHCILYIIIIFNLLNDIVFVLNFHVENILSWNIFYDVGKWIYLGFKANLVEF